MLHKNITTGDVHYLQNWSVANNTARDALSVAATDVGKVCQVTGTSTYYILTDDSPMTWQALGSGGGTVTSVTSANADATVATTTTTPVITIVQAPALRSATTTVNVSSATAPTSGQVLTATSGTAATWQTPSAGGGGITRGTATTLTTQVNVDYGSLPAGLDRITIMWKSLSINGTGGWTIRLGDSGGVENTGYTGRVSYVAGTSANNYSISTGCAWLAGTATNNESGVLTFIRLDGNTWMFEGSNSRTDSAVQYFMTGWKTLSAELTTVQFITENGTDQFDNGTINIIYE